MLKRMKRGPGPPPPPRGGQGKAQTRPHLQALAAHIIYWSFSLVIQKREHPPPRPLAYFSTEASYSSSHSFARSRSPSRAHNPSCRAHEKIMSVFFKQMWRCFAGYKTETLATGGIIAAFIFTVTDTKNLQKCQRNNAENSALGGDN